jgi:hypothetical protein
MAGPYPLSYDPTAFGGPGDWAMLYRAHGIQVVPGMLPSEAKPGQSWKRPVVPWKGAEFQSELVPPLTWDRWYGENGIYARRYQMGMITGQASGYVCMVDLDDHKTDAAKRWWLQLIHLHNDGRDPETWQQLTGGGGRHLFFRVPADWRAPTNRTPLGVDIRGQGGFAVLPPSTHDSGRQYVWKTGCEPWTLTDGPTDAPEWLLEAIDKLVAEHGGGRREAVAGGVGATGERTPSPPSDFDAFANRVDGREEFMARLVWAAVLDLHRESPIPPGPRKSRELAEAAYERYEHVTKPRVPGPKRAALEREGRGPTAFLERWNRAMAKWEDEVRIEAEKPPPSGHNPHHPHNSQLDGSHVPGSGQGEDEFGNKSRTTNGYDAHEAAWAPLPAKPALTPYLRPDEQTVFDEIPDPIITAAEFVAAFTPPEYVVDGIVQRGYLYALAAKTGHGKTAVSMYLAALVARGQPLQRRPIKAGSVLFLAGENPDDIRARFLVLAERHGFDPADVPIYFVPGVIDIVASLPVIRARVAAIKDLTLVIVDTAAAYFRNDDPNNNAQAAEYARTLRELTFLAGKPAVIVNCHPVKNAARDNLLPMGGSAFVNEVDGNLTLWQEVEAQTTLHWQGKFRGPEFQPVTFRLEPASAPKVQDAEGRDMPSVVAVPIAEYEIEAAEAEQEDDEDTLLRHIHSRPRQSWAQYAKLCGWELANGEPYKTKVRRAMERLHAARFINMPRNKKPEITESGKKEIGLKSGFPDKDFG